MDNNQPLIEAPELPAEGAVLFDCRFSLTDPDAGARAYREGHIPGAHYLDLNRDLSAPAGRPGGRHPLPSAAAFAATLARFGVGPETPVVAYDDHRLAFAARLWWMMRSLGYRAPRLLDGGYRAWLALGLTPETGPPPAAAVSVPAGPKSFGGLCDFDGLGTLLGAGALLVDSREERRYLGLEEPLDPVAGHIPGAVNRPWQEVTDEAGRVRDRAQQRARWGDALAAGRVVVYCGSGVTACVNLLSLAMVGRDDAILYPGGWSDWCARL